MSALSDKQRLFAEMVGELLRWIYANSYAVTFGDAFRDPRAFGGLGASRVIDGKAIYGRRSSNHKQRLAIDLNLFKQDEYGQLIYITETEGYTEVGEYWEDLGGSWGGRFGSGDGNHFSLEHDGRR